MPGGGRYDAPTAVSLLAEPGTRILYSTNGGEPETLYSRPNEPVWGKRTVIAAVAERSTGDGSTVRSPVVRAEYVIDLSSRLGVSHVKSLYRDPSRPPGETMLAEGVRRAAGIGMKAIKLYLFKPAEYYPDDSWAGSYADPKTLAETAGFSAAFADPRIETYALTVYSTVDTDEHYFAERSTFSDAAWAARMTEERRQFRDLAGYFLTDPRFAGKTFMLQHWEGDWALRRGYGDSKAPRSAVLGMREWLQARQDGVSEAREANPGSSVRVYCAVELNKVAQARQYASDAPADPDEDPTAANASYIPTVANDVLPFVRMDLVSYSSYDTVTASLPWGADWEFRGALAYIKEKAWDGGPFGRDCLYIGEFGWPENFTDPGTGGRLSSTDLRNGIRNTVRTALDERVRWLFYWQLYDNERQDDGSIAGFHLFRPDGSRSWAGDAFAGILPR